MVDKHGKLGVGTSARFQVSEKVVAELKSGKELAEIADAYSGKSDVRSSQGVMGLITQGLLPRDECYAHAIIFAFAPWTADKVWFE